MTSIVGGTAQVAQPARTAGLVDGAHTPAAPTSEERLAEALLRCMGRWGLAKTTMEDIAREAGMSRATAYRLCPGGKNQILGAAALQEVRRLATAIRSEIDDAAGVTEALVAVVHRASCFLADHDSLRFMREHEPMVIEQYLGFERVDALLGAAGELLEQPLSRFFDPADARAVGTWLARLVLSYLQTPARDPDPTDREGARRLVTTFVLPGLPAPTTP